MIGLVESANALDSNILLVLHINSKVKVRSFARQHCGGVVKVIPKAGVSPPDREIMRNCLRGGRGAEYGVDRLVGCRTPCRLPSLSEFEVIGNHLTIEGEDLGCAAFPYPKHVEVMLESDERGLPRLLYVCLGFSGPGLEVQLELDLRLAKPKKQQSGPYALGTHGPFRDFPS